MNNIAEGHGVPHLYVQGDPYQFDYARNTEKAPRTQGFGQDIEPHGRYLTAHHPHGNYGDRWEFGTHTFSQPLHMSFGGNYGTESNWKNRLSAQYDGKKGKPLSRALLKDGYDGIVTHDEDGPREIVDLSPLRKQADLSPFTFSHEETQTGGMKHPRQVDLHAHHPDSAEPVGTLRYFPPKRRGGVMDVDNITTHHPGAGSALLNEMETRHPGSRTNFLWSVKRNNNNPDVTGHGAGNAGKPTDWDAIHPTLAPEVHRGLTLTLPSHSARVVNSAAPKHEHLAELNSALAHSSLGTHWTENERSARQFAQNAVSDYRTDVPVVVHAKTPAIKDLETRQNELYRGGVFPYGDSHSPENEVPIRKNRTVAVTGISWRPDAVHPDADENGWVHHAYDEPMQHRAKRFAPTQRLFGPTQGLDHRLFDGDHLKSDVRDYILTTLGGFWNPLYGDGWVGWSKVYFAGSEASEWTSPELEGNNDFDVLIGVNYDEARKDVPGFRTMSDQEITDLLNKQLRVLDEQTAFVWIPVSNETVNYDSWENPDVNDQDLTKSMTNSSVSMSKRTGQRLPSQNILDSKQAMSATTWNEQESLEVNPVGKTRLGSLPERNARIVERRSTSPVHMSHQQQNPGDVQHVRRSIYETVIYESTTGSRHSSLTPSLPSKVEDVGYADGMTFDSQSTMTTAAVQGNERAENASEGFFALAATKRSPISVKPIFMPQAAGWTVESPPPAPDGWNYIGPFNGTFYVNHDSWDIRRIKPYAAYDVTDDQWAVKPPHLPAWGLKDFPEGKALEQEARAVSAYVRAVLALPEPYRSQQGYALWNHLHSDRSRAFSDQGEGWWDPGNVLEKWLDQEGLWDQLVKVMVDVRAHPEKLNSPSDWSNLPKTAMPWHFQHGETARDHPEIKSVRHAGFAGYVGESPERQEDYGYEKPEHEFDEDAWNDVSPEPTHEERQHYDEHDDYPESYHDRHDRAYQEHVDRKTAEDKPDHEDDALHDFIGEHGTNYHFWQNRANLGMVNIKDRPVYATQSHVSQRHIDKYHHDPTAAPHAPGYGDYVGNEAPMFVTHEGRLHAIEGHHRVAAALQRGDDKIHAWHYDADRHGLPTEDDE
jgi:hypothetical protein